MSLLLGLCSRIPIANSFLLCPKSNPISSGKNWGYGSRVPVRDGAILVDLSRLNRILDFNEQLAYVILEPGVTQSQLYQFLQERNSKLWMDTTGSSPDTSLIGNIAERGFGHTPYGDRAANICGLEVVLANGEIIHTGLGRFSNAKATPVYHWGIGPYLDGLFFQSNLGIVTKITMWLMPAPEYFQAFYFSIETKEQLAETLDALRPLRLNQTIRSAVHIGNSYKVLAAIRQFPWQEVEGSNYLTKEAIENFVSTWNIGEWNGSGGLYGTRKQVAEARRLIKKALKGKVKKLQFLDDNKIKLARWLAKPYHYLTGLNLPEILKLLRPVYGLMKGIPTDTQIGSTYWRKKSQIPQDKNPDRDRCGLIWNAPVAPLEGHHAITIERIAKEVLTSYQFEPQISITLLTGRVLSCIIGIAYDREVDGEDDRAMDCDRELSQKLTAAGYYPYRLGINSMEIMNAGENAYNNFLQNIKKTVDPNQVLAPGRYIA